MKLSTLNQVRDISKRRDELMMIKAAANRKEFGSIRVSDFLLNLGTELIDAINVQANKELNDLDDKLRVLGVEPNA
jgi:hypothetical protein